jgi:hypothetical protein
MKQVGLLQEVAEGQDELSEAMEIATKWGTVVQ